MRYLLFLVLLLLNFKPEAAYSFNAVLLYDADFRKFISREFPIGVALSMTVWLSLYLRPVVQERCSWFRWVWLMLVTQFTAIYLNLLLLMLFGLLFYKSITQPEQAFVPYVAAAYFFCLFIYVTWWLTMLAIHKAYSIPKQAFNSEEKWYLVKKRLPVLLAVTPLYAIAYSYLLRQLG